MKTQSFAKFKTLIYAMFSMVLLCGYTSVSEIETSIIQKDYAKAFEKAQQILKENTLDREQNITVTYYLGVSELGLSQYSQARETFLSVLHSSVRISANLYDRAWLGVIDSLGLEEKFEESLRESERFLKDRPQSEFLSVIYLKLGRANLKLSRWDKAQGYLKKVIREFPKSFEAFTAQQLLDEKRYFAIQVGSFLDQNRALHLVEELKQKGEYAYLVETKDKDGRPFYRVRVGQLTSLEEAHQMRKHLSSQGYPTHIFP